MKTKKQREKEINEMVKDEQEYYRPIAIKIHIILDERNGLLGEITHLLERIENQRYKEQGYKKVWFMPKFKIIKVEE